MERRSWFPLSGATGLALENEPEDRVPQDADPSYPPPMRISVVALGSMLLLSLGCDSAPEPTTSSPPAPTAPKAPDAEPAESADGGKEAGEPEADAKPPAEPTGPADVEDAAFFAVRDKGIIALTDAGFQPIPGIQSIFLAEFLFGADGVLYARTSSDIVKVQTSGLTSVAPLGYDEVGSVAGFDVSSKGEVWVVSGKGVSVYRDGAWATEDKSSVGLGDDFEVGLALDSSDEPWAATSGSIVRRTGGKWEPASLPKGPTKFLSKMRRGNDGQVYLSTYDHIYRLTGTPGRVKVKKGSYDTPGKFAFSQTTYGVAISGLENASIFHPADRAVLYRKKELGIGNISGISIDEQGRVWAAGDGGVAIAGPGDARVTWRSGSMEAIAGQVSELVVRGKGPTLPEAGAIKKGGLRGRIMKDGAGVAGVKVELCESPSMIYSRTPCTGAPTHLRGKTDAEGNFSFDDVPLGAYGMAIKSGRKWKITLGAAMGTKMTEGATYDIGTVELE